MWRPSSVAPSSTSMVCYMITIMLGMLTLTLLTPTHAALSDIVWPPRAATPASGYYKERGIFQQKNYFMNILSDEPSMVGSMVWVPPSFGIQFGITGYLDGLPYYQTEIVLPNESDDIFGCAQSYKTVNEFNETFAGKAVILRRGKCDAGLVGKRGEQMGAGVTMIVGCDAAAPYNCRPNLNALLSATRVFIPVAHTTTPDGYKLEAYLTARRVARKQAALNATLGLPVGPIPPPLYMRVLSTGPMDPVELAAIKNVARWSDQNQDTVNKYPLGGLPTWNLAFADNATADPCLERHAGTWCENGHLITIDMRNMEWRDRYSNHSALQYFGAFTKMRVLSIELNQWSGPIPQEFCNLTDLRFFWGAFQAAPGFSSIPACISTSMPYLEYLAMSTNSIPQMPDFTGHQFINYLDFSLNKLTALPPNFETYNRPGMAWMDVSFNKLTSLPLIKNFTSLAYFIISGNQITSDLTSDMFDGCVSLYSISLNNNQLGGVLPLFPNSKYLNAIDVSNNKIGGSIPSIWPTNIPNLVTLTAHHNQLVSPVTYLSQITTLVTIDLSWNKLTLQTPGLPPDFATFWPGGGATQTLRLDHNNIAGFWGEYISPSLATIKTLTLSYNGLQNLPILLVRMSLTYVDLSFNNLTTWYGPSSPIAGWQYFNLQGNPKLVLSPVPSWIAFGTQMILTASEAYLCPELIPSLAPTMKFLVDPELTSFTKCRCNKGTFGSAPKCYPVPLTSVLETSAVNIVSTEVGSDFRQLIDANSGRSNGSTSSNSTQVDRSLSDSWYGQSRLTMGLSTNWVIDLRTEPAPIRYITLYIHLSRTLFVDMTDTISIYEGDASLKSERVDIIRGTDELPTISSVPYTESAQYQATYASQFSSIAPAPISLWIVRVFGPIATISFTSRDQNGTHFFATYDYSTQCPDGYFLDQNIQRCRADLEVYDVSTGAQIAVYATAAFALVFQLGTFIFVGLNFHTAIIRAASRYFMLLLLVFLMMLSGGSILYAVVPDANKSGASKAADMLCEARGWMTALPLTGLLGVLLAKTNRMSEIFTSSKLQIRVISDTEILVTVAALVGVVSILLGVFSGVPLTVAQSNEGSGSLTNLLVRECHMNSGFGPWIGVMLVFLAILLLVATYLSFKTRDLPSRFNESTHIMNAVILCLFYGCLIVPLAFFISDNPNAALLIQGVGQALGSLLLSLTLFTPKIYYILFGGDRGIQQNSKVTANTHTGGTTDGTPNKSSGSGSGGIPVGANKDTSSSAEQHQRRSTHVAGAATTPQSSAGISTIGGGGAAGRGSSAGDQRKQSVGPSRAPVFRTKHTLSLGQDDFAAGGVGRDASVSVSANNPGGAAGSSPSPAPTSPTPLPAAIELQALSSPAAAASEGSPSPVAPIETNSVNITLDASQ